MLEAWCRAPSTPQSDVKRARIVLLAAAGRSTRSIAQEVGVQPRIVSKWRWRLATRARICATDTPRRTHAECPPPLCGVDAGQDDERSRQGRPGNHRAVRSNHEGQAASRAGLPLVSRHHQPGEELRSSARRSGLPARQRHRCDHLRLDRVDPQKRSRQSLRGARLAREAANHTPFHHDNIRGRDYYH